jgi:hypothetical protein|tara:strand:- start:30243 stop:30470 length:228 start_codon:yes stop_codon:yes gene_type:complete
MLKYTVKYTKGFNIPKKVTNTIPPYNKALSPLMRPSTRTAIDKIKIMIIIGLDMPFHVFNFILILPKKLKTFYIP